MPRAHDRWLRDAILVAAGIVSQPDMTNYSQVMTGSGNTELKAEAQPAVSVNSQAGKPALHGFAAVQTSEFGLKLGFKNYTKTH